MLTRAPLLSEAGSPKSEPVLGEHMPISNAFQSNSCGPWSQFYRIGPSFDCRLIACAQDIRMFVAKRSHLKPMPHRLNADEFEAIVRAHEIFISGRQGGGRTIPRFIVGHAMRCDRRRLMDADFNAADLSRSSFIEPT
jgi:hypothetical protein